VAVFNRDVVADAGLAVAALMDAAVARADLGVD
jgi:hypothetical protein